MVCLWALKYFKVLDILMWSDGVSNLSCYYKIVSRSSKNYKIKKKIHYKSNPNRYPTQTPKNTGDRTLQ